MKSEKNIVIEGGVVKLQKTETYKEISLHDFLSIASKKSYFSTNLLPRNCRFYEKTLDKEIFVTEDYPIIRKIKVVHLNTKIYNYTISLPWIIYVFIMANDRVREFYIFCTQKQITSLNDFLYEIPLTNIHNNSGLVCMGNIKETNPEKLIKEFWNSTFNQDYLPEWFKNKKGGIKSYRHWSNLTKNDHSFIFRIRLKKYKKLKDFLSFETEKKEVFFTDNVGINVNDTTPYFFET